MKKIGLLSLALVLALGSLGMGYATWKDDVQIDGTVHMNDFLVGILDGSVSTSDNEHLNDPIKEVGDCTAVLSDPEDSVHHDPAVKVWHTMTIDVTGAYPCYEQYINFKLKNAGTVPAHIVLVEYTSLELTWNGVDAFVNAADEAVINVAFVKDWNENCYPDPDEPDVTACQQIDPCTEVPVVLALHFKEAAEECHTYHFKIYIEAIQWNKYVP